MSLSEIWQTSFAILTSLGGGGAIVIGLSSWLGKVWASRILEQDRKKYTIEIEELKARLQHEMQLVLKQQDQYFNLSVTSHMATVVFDKHVAFCEEYAARAIKAVEELSAYGLSENVLSIPPELKQIRKRYAPWVTEDITKKLKRFEDAIIDIGLKAKYQPMSETLTQAKNNLLNIIGLPEEGNENLDIQADQIIVFLQNALNISELAYLRDVVAKKAIQISSNQ
jgi:hypothetical protein